MPDARSPHLVPTPRDGVAIVLRFARAVFFGLFPTIQLFGAFTEELVTLTIV